MPRVASLYLPNLATDRIRRLDRPRGGGRLRPSLPRGGGERDNAQHGGGAPQSAACAGDWLPAARWPENAKERAKLLALREKKAREEEEGHRPGQRIGDCSSPRGGGWRPGARWAQADEGSDEWLERRIARKASKKAALLAEIETLPLHQRPPVRELGRRSEAMPNPFRPMAADEAKPAAGRSPYDLDGAFWQQGRSLGGAVARAVGAAQSGETREAPALPPEYPPLVTARRDGPKMTVAAACPAAQALGLHSGMALTQARAMVPGLDIRPADPAGEAADLDRLAHHAARHWTPLVMAVEGEGLWLDIGASAHLFGGERRFARRVLQLCRRLGFAARIAIADTAVAAHALARCSAEPLTLCPSGREAEAIADLPVAALRIDPAVAALARRLGIETAGALFSMPRAPLVRRFGKDIVARLDEASGARGNPIDPVVPASLPSATRRFAEPILTAEAIVHALDHLVGELTAILLERGLGARALALTLTRIDAVDQRIAVGFARPTRDPAHILRLLCTRVEKVEPGFGIERIALVAERSDPLAPQHVHSPIGASEPADDLAVLIDKLATRLGWRRLYRASAVESDVPERCQRRIDPLDGSAQSWGRWPRPARLLDPPEPVQDVMALLPDGVPRRFTWRGRSHTIVRGDGPERIYGEWWRRSAERDAVRDYFQIEDQSGARFWLFRRGDGGDGRTGDMSWYVHGLFG